MITLLIALIQVASFLIIYLMMDKIFSLIDIGDSLVAENQIFFSISVYSNMIFSLALMMTLSCAYQQLVSLNKFLSKLSTDQNQMLNKLLLNRVAIIFDKMCDILDGTSKFYLFSLLGFMLGFAYFNMFFIYLLFLNIKLASREILYFSASSTLWMFYFSPGVIILTTLASWIEREGRKTVNIMQQLINCDNNNTRDLKSLHLLIQQTSHRSSRISCGLFLLNWKFFFSMLGAIFSFSIILIQFYDVKKQ